MQIPGKVLGGTILHPRTTYDTTYFKVRTPSSVDIRVSITMTDSEGVVLSFRQILYI